jgi:hypothetical protein
LAFASLEPTLDMIVDSGQAPDKLGFLSRDLRHDRW